VIRAVPAAVAGTAELAQAERSQARVRIVVGAPLAHDHVLDPGSVAAVAVRGFEIVEKRSFTHDRAMVAPLGFSRCANPHRLLDSLGSAIRSPIRLPDTELGTRTLDTREAVETMTIDPRSETRAALSGLLDASTVLALTQGVVSTGNALVRITSPGRHTNVITDPFLLADLAEALTRLNGPR